MKLIRVPKKHMERRPYSDRGADADGLMDPVPAGSPLQTAQLIGSLVIRFVMYAESGQKWENFPDKHLVECILRNAKDRELAEHHLVRLLFHHSKILDNCGAPNNLKRLTRQAFPKAVTKAIEDRQHGKKLEDPEWEILEAE